MLSINQVTVAVFIVVLVVAQVYFNIWLRQKIKPLPSGRASAETLRQQQQVGRDSSTASEDEYAGADAGRSHVTDGSERDGVDDDGVKPKMTTFTLEADEAEDEDENYQEIARAAREPISNASSCSKTDASSTEHTGVKLKAGADADEEARASGYRGAAAIQNQNYTTGAGTVPVYDEDDGIRIEEVTGSKSKGMDEPTDDAPVVAEASKQAEIEREVAANKSEKVEEEKKEEEEEDENKEEEEKEIQADPADRERNAEKATETKERANELYRKGEYDEAMKLYKEALDSVPNQEVELAVVMINNIAATHLAKKEYTECVIACDEALELKSDNFKARIRRYRAHTKLEKWHDALSDLKTALDLDPLQKPRFDGELKIAEKKAQEQFEKEKEEMIGKLKDFGNWALGKVGLSLDNFSAVQDPKTGSYNIQYVPPGGQSASNQPPASDSKFPNAPDTSACFTVHNQQTTDPVVESPPNSDDE